MEIAIKNACKLKLGLENTYKGMQARIFFEVEDTIKARHFLHCPSIFYFPWSLESINQQIKLMDFRKL